MADLSHKMADLLQIIIFYIDKFNNCGGYCRVCPNLDCFDDKPLILSNIIYITNHA